ncbi:MAG: hypothetical protein ACJ8FJ_11870, partial [Sphingomicrobium sp.]
MKKSSEEVYRPIIGAAATLLLGYLVVSGFRRGKMDWPHRDLHGPRHHSVLVRNLLQSSSRTNSNGRFRPKAVISHKMSPASD